MSCISIRLTISGSTGCQFCERFLSGPLKPPPHFLLRGERVQLQRGNTLTTHTAPPLGQSVQSMLFSLPHENIPNLLQDTHKHPIRSYHNADTHSKKVTQTNISIIISFFFNRCVAFVLEKTIENCSPPMLIVSIFIMSPRISRFHKPVVHIFSLSMCRFTINKL